MERVDSSLLSAVFWNPDYHLINILARAIPTHAIDTTGLSLSPFVNPRLTNHSSWAENPKTACFVILEEIREVASQIRSWANNEENCNA